MNLFIDFGNSRCKWALHDGINFIEVAASDYPHADVSECTRELLSSIDFSRAQQIHAVSVLGQKFDNAFADQVASIFGLPTQFYYSQKHAYGIQLSYADVSTYGSDRYAALVAAHKQVAGHKIVIDCGTATTIDALDAEGRHLGGLIMPGANLMLETLAAKTSGIPSIHSQHPVNLLCDNTRDAVFSGCILQLRFAVQGMIKQLAKQPQTTIFLTGGESDLLDPDSLAIDGQQCIHSPHLVLEGVWRMHD